MVFKLRGEITEKLTELPEQITCIDTGYIRPRLAGCYLLVENGMAAIIETGTAYSLDTIKAVLQIKGIEPGNVRYIMPTHVHLDHAGGAGHLMRQFPSAELVVHPRGARHMIDPSKLWQGALEVYGEKAMYELYEEIIPVDESRVIIADDGYTLDFNGRQLLFIDTPGHARHHYCIYDERSRGFFSGDTFGMAYEEISCPDSPYIMPTTTPVQFDPDTWYSTLDRLMSFKPERMYLTHYGMVEQVEKLRDDLQGRIQQYVEIAETFKDVNNRATMIGNRIVDETLAELRSLNCTLPPAACRAMLQGDVSINVQGLEHWLDNRLQNQ